MPERRRIRSEVLGAVLLASAAFAPAASAQGPLDAVDPIPPLAYCEGTADGGLSGELTTDREHTRSVPGRPLPGLRERRLRAAGIRTVALEAGPRRAREAVVYVHGNPGSSRDWGPLLRSTSRIRRSIAIDMPGFGAATDATDRPDHPFGLAAAARFLDLALEKLGVRRAHLVLHDWGGPFGLEWASKRPRALASVVLIDTGILPGYLGHPALHAWRTPAIGEATMAAVNRGGFRRLLQLSNPKPLPERFLDRMYDDFDRGTRCSVLRLVRSVNDPTAMANRHTEALRPHRIPALVLWGRGDAFVPASFAYRQREAFPDAEVHVFEDAGHWPFVDEPERARGLVMRFLRRVTASSRRGRRPPGSGKRTRDVRPRADSRPGGGGILIDVSRRLRGFRHPAGDRLAGDLTGAAWLDYDGDRERFLIGRVDRTVTLVEGTGSG